MKRWRQPNAYICTLRDAHARTHARKFSFRSRACASRAFIFLLLLALASPTLAQVKENPTTTNYQTGIELRIVAANVQLLLIAPHGKKTGYDAKSRKQLRAIPDSAYYQDALLAYDSGRVDPNTTQTVDVRHAPAGKYKLLVSQGTAADGEEFEVLIHLYSRDGREASFLRLSGTVKPGAPAAFDFDLKNTVAPRLILLTSRS